MIKNESNVKVSVCVVTYNQEKYIAQCLQSVADQETNFEFEIVIGEDCSTDETRRIVDEFASRYSKLVVKNYHSSNVGAVKNVVSTYKAATGKYICHLDGDDFALAGKLQMQYDVMESNPDCVICSHDMQLINNDGRFVRNSFRKKKAGKYSVLDLYEDLPFFAHSSKMFRNDLGECFWDELHANALDIEVHVEQAKKGGIIHIDQALGTYRLFSGVSSQAKSVNPLLVEGTERVFDKATQDGFYSVVDIKKAHAMAFFKFAYQSAIFGDEVGLRKYILKSFSLGAITRQQVVFYKLSRAPGLVVFLCQFRSRLKGYRI